MGQGATLPCSGLFREGHLSPLCSLPSRSAGFLARPGSPRAWPGTGGPEVEPVSPSAEGRRRAQASPLHPQTTPRRGMLPALLSAPLPHLPWGQPEPCPQVTGRAQHVLCDTRPEGSKTQALPVGR